MMRLSIRSFVIVLFCLSLFVAAVAAADETSAGVSSAAADTSGPPPQEAAAYISAARDAVAVSDWTSVLTITTRGLAWYPDNPDLLCLQGYTCRKMGQYQKSVDLVSKAILLDPTAVRYANRGYGYLALGNYTAALADAEAGITHDANYTANYAVKALAESGLGRNGDALIAADSALAQAPDSAHYWHVKGIVLAAKGDCTGAARALEKSAELDPAYVLPWPGFGSATEKLAIVNAGCTPAPAATTPAKSPLGWIVVAGIGAAAIVYRYRE
jgi:tetratricopeptide (TPR) repeat protein